MPNLNLHLFNGLRENIEGARFQATVVDGRQKVLPPVIFDQAEITIPFVLSGDTIRDAFTINVSAKGYRDAGYIGLRFDNNQDKDLHLMLIHRDAQIRFQKPKEWPVEWAPLLARIGDGFPDFADQANLEGALLMNLLEAYRLFPLPVADKFALFGDIPLKKGIDKITRATRQAGVLQDRMLLFVDASLRAQLKALPSTVVKAESAAAHGGTLPGETVSSFKEVRFPEANVQFTLFESAGTVYGDLDMDYFRDKLSHGLLEFFPNTLFGTRTDPRKMYGLRWMAGKNQTAPDNYAPPYVLAP